MFAGSECDPNESSDHFFMRTVRNDSSLSIYPEIVSGHKLRILI